MFRNRQSLGAALVVVALVSLGAIAVAHGDPQSRTAATPAADSRTVVFSITHGPDSIFELVTALHVAEDAIQSGNHVILFFNGRGVTIPVKRLKPDLQLGNERTLWQMLRDLSNSNAEFVVAKESARVLGMVQDDFLAGTQFGEWGGSIFQKMPKNCVVFSY